MVRAVQSNVHEWCGGPEDARQMGATHDAVGSSSAFQQGVDVRVVPAVMAKLDGDANPLRHGCQEVVESGVVAFKIWRELRQQHSLLSPSSCQQRTIRSTQTSGLNSFLPCVRPPRGAFTDMAKPGGSRSLQLAKDVSRGHR